MKMQNLNQAQTQNVLWKRKIAFIGCGVMAEAIMSTLLRGEQVDASQLTGSDPFEARRRDLSAKYGVRLTRDNRDAAQGADIVMLTVKPQTLSMGRSSQASAPRSMQSWPRRAKPSTRP